MYPENSSTEREASKVWSVAWPLILTNMLNVIVGTIDLKMVGNLGDTSAIAAVGLSRGVMMIIFIIMIAISGGASVMVAHAYGSGNRRKVSEIASKSVMFMLLAAVFVVMPAGLLSVKWLLTELGGREDPRVVELGSQYLQILFIGSLVTMFNFALTGILVGVGKTKISLVMLVFVNLFNILFNYIFIFGIGFVPAFGVAGAALGTFAARGLGAFAGLWILRSPRFSISLDYRSFFTFDTGLLKQILFLGGPRSLQGIVRNFSRMMIFWMIARLPDTTEAISAYSVAMQVRMFSIFTGLAFMSAAMSRVGQNMGAGKPDLAEKSGWIAARLSFILLTFTSVIFVLFPSQIMLFFTQDRIVVAKGVIMFVAVAVTEPLMAMAFSLGGALRGGGDPVTPFICGSVADLAVVFVAGYLFAFTFRMGFSGIALGLALSSVFRTIPIVWKYRKGDWKTNKLLRESA